MSRAQTDALPTADASAEAAGDTHSTTGQRPNGDDDVPHVSVVTDGQKDIAKSELLEQITVGVPGRRHFQRVYVRKSGSGGKTTVSYKPDDDAPADDRPLSIIPTIEEVQSRTETLEFLVVGIVLATNPTKYSSRATGSASRSKQRDAERASRGILPPETNMLRAVVQTTDFISTGSIKYYVACHQVHGLCNLRVISSDAIFYFEEIWGTIPDNLSAKERRRQLGAACKIYAARDKKPVQRALIPVVAADSTASNSIAITPTVNAANVLSMQYSLYAVSKEPSAIAALQKTLENILPDLLNRPSDEGILGFYDFKNALQEEDAAKAVTALMAVYPMMPKLDTNLVFELHAALRRTGLGGKLSYKSLMAFLRWGQDRAVAGWEPGMLDSVVEAIIHDIGIADEIRDIATTRTASKLANKETDLTPLLSGLRVALSEIVNYFNAQATALREQHGGVNRHASINDLMIRVGNCVDKTALKVLEEQVFAIHAEQLASANSNGIKYIEKCISLIDQAIAITP